MRSGNPFRAGVVLGVLLLGAAAFLLMLYALGQGWNGQEEQDGGGHARGNGLNGFSGLVTLAEADGITAEIGYSAAAFDEYPLLVITPRHYASGETIEEIIAQRKYTGPTVIILPKWNAMRIPEIADVEHEPGWVMLGEAASPSWFEELAFVGNVELRVGETSGWNGYGASGALPAPAQVQALAQNDRNWITPLVTDSEGDVLAARFDHAGDEEAWPVTFVFEPDLMNNYGMADYERAQVAMEILHDAAWDETEIVFDVSMVGLGRNENLLTLAFAPPFLAATLSLLLAALVIGWRAFRRFGPTRIAAPAFAQGKRALASNGAALIKRVRRWHLLAQPYADLVTARLARSLNIRSPDLAVRILAIDTALQRAGHGGPAFGQTLRDLREARHPREILRGARILRDMERTLKR